MEDRAASIKAYERFISAVRESQRVYGLCAPDGGWAVSPSHEDEEIDVLMFWSDEANAARQRKGEWKDYVPTAIPLEDFIHAWLQGMHEDGVLVGPNWDDLSGLECTALEVAQRLEDDPEEE